MDPSLTTQPAVAGPDVIYPDPLIVQYTLEALNDEGYINSDVTDKMRSLKYNPGAGALLRVWDREQLLAVDPNGDQVEKGLLRKDEPHHIHPTLQRTQWVGIQDRDWEAILPSVELASRFLDEPCITPFFHGLENATELRDPLLRAAHGDLKFHRFDIDNSIMNSKDKLKKALFSIMSMRDKVQFKFADEGEADASTGWSKKLQLACVNFHQNCLYILRQDPGWNPQRWSRPWAPGTHEPSARFRTRVHLAISIVHELTHCAWFIKCKGEGLPEPYLRDRPTNELGWEVENFIWTGIIETSNRGSHISAPYGIHIARFPGHYKLDDAVQNVYTRGAPQDWGVTWTTKYPVSMKWCRALFKEDFWDQVSRYGFIYVRPRRIKGVRLRIPTSQKVRVGDDTMDHVTRSHLQYLEDGRVITMEAGVKADDIDSSDEEDVDANSIVIRGRHKRKLEEEREEELRKQREEDGDIEMSDA